MLANWWWSTWLVLLKLNTMCVIEPSVCDDIWGLLQWLILTCRLTIVRPGLTEGKVGSGPCVVDDIWEARPPAVMQPGGGSVGCGSSPSPATDWPTSFRPNRSFSISFTGYLFKLQYWFKLKSVCGFRIINQRGNVLLITDVNN